MSQGDMNSSNYSDQQKDDTNEFNLNSENSIDESTGQENCQYSDKTVFDQDLTSHNILDKLEDTRTEQDNSVTDNKEIIQSEQNLADITNFSNETTGTEGQEASIEGKKEADGGDTQVHSDREQSAQEIEPKDTTETTNTESVNGESETKLEPELVTKDTTETTYTGSDNEETESKLERETVTTENKSEVNDSKEETDSVAGQVKQNNLQEDQQVVDREPDKQKETNEEENNKDDFEADHEHTTLQEKNTELDQQLPENKETTEKDEPNIVENNTENKQDNNLNKGSSENGNISATDEKDVLSENKEIENDEQEKVDVGNESEDSEVKKEEKTFIPEHSNQKDSIHETRDKQISSNELDTNTDSTVSDNDNISESKKNIEQDKDKYKVDKDNDDFWDIGESDKDKQKEVKSEINEERNTATGGNLSSNSDTEADSKQDYSKMEPPKSDMEETDTKSPVDQGEYLSTTEETDGLEINTDLKRVDNKTDKSGDKEEKESSVKEPSPEPIQQPDPEPVKQESLLDQLLKRNVEIDGSVESISELDINVTTLLQSMKTVVKHYGDLLGQQSLRDFSQNMGKFRGDFQSINDAYRRCGQLATTMNNRLKELRHATEDVKNMIYRKFQNEDLATWIDIAQEKEAEKQKLQEQVVAAEKAAMAKAAEARSAMATATVGVAEANQFVAEMETQAAEAEAVAKKAGAHAQQALVAAEEARLAAEEKKRAEELAKQRAEERARKKEEEEKKKKAEEELKIYQESARKGTSVDDERKLLQQDKEKREAERRDPKNWPRYTYAVESGDFDPRVGCIIRAIDGTIRKDDLECRRIGQETGILQLTNNEELISNIIEVTPTDSERKFHFEEAMSVALPVCIKRTPFAREAVIKKHQSNGRWIELHTADVVFEDHREQRFVETRIKKFGTFVVVLRYKKDTLMLLKKGTKVTSAVDSRISFTSRPGAFKVDSNFSLEVHPVDQNNVSDLRLRAPQDCEDLYTCSPFIKLSLPTRNTLAKPLTITLPLPPHHTRQKRPQTAVARDQSRDIEARPSTARPQSTQERKEESTEEVHFVYLDEKNGWTKNTKTVLTQITNKDMVSLDITQPYQRFIVLRTKIGLKNFVVEKMALLLDRSLTQRNVRAFLRQRNEDLYDVAISCETSEKTDRALKYLTEEGFAEGGPPSKDLILKEGQPLFIKFRGNVQCVDEKPELNLIFNTHIKCRTDLKVMELDTFAQKGLPCYRGFAQVFTRALVPKPVQEGTTRKPNEPPEMVEAEILLAELLIEIPKPEVEPPKPLTVVPVKLMDGPLNDGVFQHLANELGKEWKDVAAHLNLKSTRIQAILRQNVNKDTAKTRYDMLVSWAKRIPKSVDKVLILVHALQAAGRPDLAEEIRYRGDEFRQQRFMSARVSYLRQAFVKVAKVNTVFKQWKDFAKGLGVPDDEIQKIEEKGGSGQEKCYSSLETWKELSGEKATVQDLATHLKDVRQDRLSRDVEALVAT